MMPLVSKAHMTKISSLAFNNVNFLRGAFKQSTRQRQEVIFARASNLFKLGNVIFAR